MALSNQTALPDNAGVLTKRNLDQLQANITTSIANNAIVNTLLGGAAGAPTGTGAIVLGTAPTISGALLTGNPQASVGPNYIATEGGANNAITSAAASGPTLATGLVVRILLAHTLQAGANTFAYNGGVAANIKSHRNPASNIAVAYAVGGVIELAYDGTQWLDMSQ